MDRVFFACKIYLDDAKIERHERDGLTMCTGYIIHTLICAVTQRFSEVLSVKDGGVM